VAPDHRRENDESRERLRALVSRLDHTQLATNIAEDWSVSALLAHLGFWDRFTLNRWRLQLAGTAVSGIAPLDDVINDAALPMWRVLPPEAAAREAMAAADAIDAFVAALTRETVEQVRKDGRIRWISRSLHRSEHLDEIERALAG
jgi:hypothetical protein